MIRHICDMLSGHKPRHAAALLFIVALICVPSSVDAIGVSPGRTTINFEPGLEKTISFTILNDNHKRFSAYVYVEGDLKDYIAFDRDSIEFDEDDSSKVFTYSVKLPEKLGPPGDHWGKIIVLDLPPSLHDLMDKANIKGTVAVMHQLRVKVPFPGEYAQVSLSVHEAGPNETVQFYVKVQNLGKKDITDILATVDIVGPDDEHIATLNGGPVSVKSMDKTKIVLDWNANVPPGEYYAVAEVAYGDETESMLENFFVGSPFIEVLGVLVKGFNLGGIAKFDILTESVWNRVINDVYAHMVVKNKEEKEVGNFRSATIDMGAFEKKNLYAYWDTENVEVGEYMTKLSLHYADTVTERDVKTRVALNSIRMEVAGVDTGAFTAEDIFIDQYPITIFFMIIVVTNMAWFFYFRKRRQNK